MTKRDLKCSTIDFRLFELIFPPCCTIKFIGLLNEVFNDMTNEETKKNLLRLIKQGRTLKIIISSFANAQYVRTPKENGTAVPARNNLHCVNQFDVHGSTISTSFYGTLACLRRISLIWAASWVRRSFAFFGTIHCIHHTYFLAQIKGLFLLNTSKFPFSI